MKITRMGLNADCTNNKPNTRFNFEAIFDDEKEALEFQKNLNVLVLGSFSNAAVSSKANDK